MMRVARLPVVGIVAATLCCASTPEIPRLDRAMIRSIERGVTTEAQVEEWFGLPTDLRIWPSGRMLWRYERRTRELERPGPVRNVLCPTFGWIPVVQLLFWSGLCEQVELREELELRFSQEKIVVAIEFNEALERPGRMRAPVVYPVPFPHARSPQVADSEASAPARAE